MQHFGLYRMMLFSERIISQKMPISPKQLRFLEKSQMFFFAGFAILTEVALKMVALSSELDSASTDIKIAVDH